jgi:hypothetical protein
MVVSTSTIPDAALSVYEGAGPAPFHEARHDSNGRPAALVGGAKTRQSGFIRITPTRQGDDFMPLNSRFSAHLFGGACAAALLFASTAGEAQTGPFAMLAGSWSGIGTIKLVDGGTERIRCKASYDLVSNSNVTLNLTCASDSYKFVLLGNMLASSAGSISGNWTEQTRSVAGTVSGHVTGNYIAVSTSGALQATLALTSTPPTQQSIVLKSQGTSIQQMSISMKRI